MLQAEEGVTQEEGSVPPIASLNYRQAVSTSAVWKYGAFARMALHRFSSTALKGASSDMRTPRDT